MKLTGKFLTASVDLSGGLTATFSIDDKASSISAFNGLPKDITLSIEVKPYRKKRSMDANALLWACIGEMAEELRSDKWEVYLRMLRRYGSFTYVTVRPAAVERMKAIWRECEEVGAMSNGDVQLLCYYGSSTYDTKEFSVLLDGVISEMKDMGLQPPPAKDLERSLEEWEKQCHSATRSSST